MYRSKTIISLLTMAFVLGLAVEAGAATYTWVGGSWDQSLKLREVWKDESNQSPPTLAELNNLLNNTSLGAVFQASNDMGVRQFDASDTMLTINAPFNFSGSATREEGMSFKDQLANNLTWTFDELNFRGVMNFADPGRTVTLAGHMTVTGAANFRSDGRSSGTPAYLNIEIDASRIDEFGILFTGKTNVTNSGRLHLNNGNTAFWGKWRLQTRVNADVAGCLGDADIEVGASVRSGDNREDFGILVVNNASAVSPTAELFLCYDPNNGSYGQIQTNETISVRKLTLKTRQYSPGDPNDPNIPAQTYYTYASLPAGTYTASSPELNGFWVAGSTGSIIVADVNATAVMTMECKDHLGNTIAGDTGLMPRVGSKGFKPGYTVRIRAKNSMAISGVGYTFLMWQVNGANYSTDLDTTVTMDTSKTVTAVYTRASGASQPSPANRVGAVSIMTGVSWTPDPAATVQSVYFGTSATAVYGTDATPIYTGDGSLSSLTNAQLGGALKEMTNYYWQVRSNVTSDSKPQWVFTTGNVKATTPTPANNATEQATDLTLQWTSPDSGATSFDVYFGTDKNAVENGLVTPVNVGTNQLAQTGLLRGVWYYWRVDCKFPGRTAVGDVWGFRVNAMKIYLDTSALTALDESSNPISGVTASLDDGGVAVFKFTSFNYGQQYDVVVSGSNKLAIWSDNSINFGGVLSVSAPTNGTTGSGPAIAGGYIGGPGVYMLQHKTQPDPNYPLYRWTPIRQGGVTIRTTDYHWMNGSDMSAYRNLYIGDANYWPPVTDTIYGPGRPYAQFNYVTTTDPQYPKVKVDNVCGTGGSYGGAGGNSSSTTRVSNPTLIYTPGSNATAYAQSTTYYTSTGQLPGLYGQKELYELWGGSGGSGGGNNTAGTVDVWRRLGGGGGGGVVEFFTKGNLTIGPNAQILSNGGDTQSTRSGSTLAYPGGAGSGGSIRLVASGNVTVNGKIAANGGKGADNPLSTSSSSNVGAGGGGGRIAIYKGGTLNSAGAAITVSGGLSGTYVGIPTILFDWQSGKSGTVYGLEAGEGSVGMITAAHWPIPADGSRGIAAGTAELKWLPGLGAATNTVYFGTTTNPPVLTTMASGRARKSVSVSISLNTKYYWRVDCDGVTGPLWTFRSVGYEAKNPTPATGAVNIGTTGTQLKWQDGYPDPNTITKREVFFGTDQIAVANATTTSPLKIATVTDKDNIVVNLPALLAETTYYWRVDTYSTVSPSYIDGLVWNFTTRPPTCVNVIASDFNSDCRVTFVDFAMLAANWKACNLPNPLDCN